MFTRAGKMNFLSEQDDFLSGQNDFFRTANQPISVSHLSQPYNNDYYLLLFFNKREKQQKLNELDVVVTIKLHQIQYIINNLLPQDLSICLVFISSDQQRLQKRIKELELEKAEQKRLFR